jgi:O-antigen ligase
LRRALERALAAWSGPRAERTARGLVYAAAGLLFLQAAATVHAVFTLQLSYLAMVAAVCVGAVFVVRGWRRLPAFLRSAGLALFAVYVVATVVGRPLALPGQPRTGGIRAIVYLGDLGLGLACVGLVAGCIVAPRHVRRLTWALVLGGLAAGAYAVYQWLAQHSGWPFSDINNTLDSNGISVGVNQGTGVLGWERARGTFLEPHFLGYYAASLLPLACATTVVGRGPARWIAAAAAAALAVALVVTSSAPDVAILLLAAAVTGVAMLAGRGAVLPATVAACLATALLVVGPFVLAQPRAVAAVTNRSSSDVSETISFRTGTWSRVLDIWGQRPVLGYGAGQSSVRLAAGTDVPADERPSPPGPLQSAQGIWAASLIDGGVIGFACWMLVLGGIVLLALDLVWRRPGAVTWGVAAALVAAVAGAQITGDRLDLLVWLLIGLTATLCCAEREMAGKETAGDHQ